MPKIILEREKCIGDGSCQALCPKYFKLIEDGKARLEGSTTNPKTGNDELLVVKPDCAVSAADACPAQCIHVEK